MHTTLSVTEGLNLVGETALVTGASSGIGKECARVLALRGARVIMACRNQNKTEAVIKEFENSIGTEAAQHCEYRNCDTSSMLSVRAMADGIIAEQTKIDLLFLNAGVFGRRFHLTEDGFEYTYAANYLGHFLLLHRLMSENMLDPYARIVATLTNGIYQNPFSKADFEMLTHPSAKKFSRGNASPNSKILLALMMREFTRRAKGTSLPSCEFIGGDPGATLTDNIHQLGPFLRFIAWLLRPFLFKSVDKGAAVLLWAATNPKLEGQSGKLYSHRLREIHLPAKSSDPQLAERAWKITEQALGLSHL